MKRHPRVTVTGARKCGIRFRHVNAASASTIECGAHELAMSDETSASEMPSVPHVSYTAPAPVNDNCTPIPADDNSDDCEATHAIRLGLIKSGGRLVHGTLALCSGNGSDPRTARGADPRTAWRASLNAVRDEDEVDIRVVHSP